MSFKHTLTAAAIMILTTGILYSVSHGGEDIHPNKPFETFPKQIGEWVGKENFLAENMLEEVGADDYFLADYNNSKGHWINLYVSFYQSQKEGDLIHSPKNCMPGAGWSIPQTSLEELEFPGDNPHKIKAIKLDLTKGPRKQIMLYWFQSRGRFISSEYMQKIYLVIDSITRQRTDGSFVRLIAPVVNNEAETLNHLKDFARQIMPKLKKYIPS
ncbi:EpsI family protein [Desulfobacterales bacterium HSG2]|nr:EpsI family protein [Desulfobacterales bacterium HSG2]